MPGLDELAALLPQAANASAPMPGPMPMPAPQIAQMPPDLPTSATPMRETGPDGSTRSRLPWADIMRTLAPLLGSAVTGEPSFGQGFQQGAMMAAQEQDKRRKESEAKREQAAKFRMEIFDAARQITDPREWAQFVNLATDSAMQMGLISEPGEIKSFLEYPAHLETARKQKELLEKLDAIVKQGYDLDELMALDKPPVLTLKDGSRIGLGEAITISGAFPEGQGGVMLPPKAKRQPVTVGRGAKLVDPETGRVIAEGSEAPRRPVSLSPGGRLVDPVTGKVIATAPHKPEAVPSKEPPQASPYAIERATRTLDSVRALSKKVNRWTTGIGSTLARIPETDARNFAAELDTLKATIAFSELAAMREASKTGGALGAVSEREMQLLSSALGALDAGQSPANIKAQLKKIEDSITRWQAAHGVSSHAPAAAGPKIGERRMINGQPGEWDGKGWRPVR